MTRPNPSRLALRYADLNPALGDPGGSCYLQKRIRDRVRGDKVQDYLIDKHQNEQKFTEAEENAIYPMDLDVGKAGSVFYKILLRTHAMHRMDLRSVKLEDIKQALVGIGNAVLDTRRRFGDMGSLERELRDTMSGGGGRFRAPNGLTLYLRVFKIARITNRKGKTVTAYKVRVESAFWTHGTNPDPVPEHECPHSARVAHRYALKMAPTPGIQTVVTNKSQMGLPTDTDREKEVVLPLGSATPGGEGRVISQFSYNGPDSGSDIKPRTLGLPGEQYGHPSKNDYNTVTRRSMTAAVVPNPKVHSVLRRMARDAIAAADEVYPEWYFVPRLGNLSTMPDYGHSDAALPRGAEGEEIVAPDPEDGGGIEKSAYRRRWQQGKYQRKSRGRAKHKRQQYYRKNKAKIKMRQKRWRTKNKNKPAYKQWSKKRRSMNRSRRVAGACMVAFAHRRASVLTVPDIAFVIGPEQILGYVHSISPMSGMVTVELDGSNMPQLDSLPVELFMRMAAFLTDKDSDAFFDLVDVEIGPMAYGDLDPSMVRDCARRYDRNPDADDFRSDCFDLTDEYNLSSMGADQLDAVTQSIVQTFIESGFGRSREDADNPEISEAYDPSLFYGEVDVQR